MKLNNILKTGLLALMLVSCSPQKQEHEKNKTRIEYNQENHCPDLAILFIYDLIMNNPSIPSISNSSNIIKQKITHIQSSNKIYEIQVFETVENIQEIWITRGYTKKQMLSFTDTSLDGLLDNTYSYNPSKIEQYEKDRVAITYDIMALPNPKNYQEEYLKTVKEVSKLLEKNQE